MSALTIADSFYIGVLDLAAATAWYTQKLGLRKVPVKMGEARGCIALGFSKNDDACITLGPRVPTGGVTPMLYAAKADSARDALSSRGVIVSEIQKDRQGTHFFEIRDLEDNGIEVSEEP
jgi:hypothetical protein